VTAASRPAPFTKLRDVAPDQLDQAIDSFTEDEWDRIEKGYLEVAAHQLGDWWKPYLGLHEDVDVLLLLCNLYHRSLVRTEVA
jgi:hypothetical protein